MSGQWKRFINDLLPQGTRLQLKKDSSVNGRVFYGYARPGIETSEPQWLIYVEDTIGSSFDRIFAEKDGEQLAEFVHVWDDRATIIPEIELGDNEFSTDFDGANDYCNGGDIHLYDNADAFTVNLWVKPQNTAAQRALFSKTTNDVSVFGWVLYHNNSGQLFLQMRASGTNRQHTYTTSTLTSSVWQMVTLAYAGGSNINGALAYINASAGTTPSSASLASWLAGQDFTLGSRNTGFNFSGRIDHVTIWDKQLTSGEVTELYNSGVIFNPTAHSANANLQSWYRMGDNDTFPTISDNVNSDDLTMTNMASDDFVMDVP